MERVSRRDVVQSCLDLFHEPDYLEVGVCEGSTFRHIRAARKVAVDPAFAPGVLDELRPQAGVEAHEVTSDAYFGTIAGERRFDVIYLDGLHTFEQTLRDLLNALVRLKDPGVIVIDDVYPDSYHGSLPDRERTRLIMRHTEASSRKWMGDVYRLTFFIDSFAQQLSYRMTSNNHGQLIVWRKARPSVAERSVEAVARMPFEQIFVEPEAQRRAPLEEIVAEVARDLGRAIPAKVAPVRDRVTGAA